jgi:hypothetical protein
MRSWRRRTAAVLVAAAMLTPALGGSVASAEPGDAPDVASVLATQAAVLQATGAVSAERAAALNRIVAGFGAASDDDEPGAEFGLGPGASIVAVGGRHTCAAALLSEVWCWGANDEGQLGVGTTTDSLRPVRASAVGELRDGIPMTLSAGRAHTCALSIGDVDTVVHCWGANNEGQLGDGTTTDRTRPVEAVTGALGLAAGQEHTCVITDTRTVSCWGRNDVGQLGTGTAGGNESSPQTVPGLADIVDIAADDNNTCAVDENGDAWCWGSDTHGQLGDGGGSSGTPEATPVAVSTTGVSGGFLQIDVGNRHVCALAESSAVYCWGSDSAGQLGNGTATPDTSRPSVVTAGGRPFVSVDAGGDSTCATSRDGQAYCWGDNSAGQLGTGDGSDHDVPAAVDQSAIRRSPLVEYLLGLDKPMVADVTVGTAHSCAFDINLTVYCSGSNDAGQLGDGTTGDATVPTVTILAPGPVSGVGATAGDKALQVRWTAPADPGVAPVSGYVAVAIHGTGEEALDNSRGCDTTAQSCTVKDLINDRRYDVLVGAVTLGGVSYSDSIVATPKGGGSGGGLPITGPGVPVQVAVAAMLIVTGAFCLLLTRRRAARS